MDIVQILVIILGMIFFAASFIYGKKEHKRFADGASSAQPSDSIIALVIIIVFSVFLSISPWWLTKILILSIGIGFIYAGFFMI